MSLLGIRLLRSWAPTSETVAGLAAATLLILFVLRLSATAGRLAMPLAWDDVGYITSGFDRYQEIVKGDLRQLVGSFLREHAPFQSLQATIGFLIFGVHDWAPYAVSGALLFLVVFAVRNVVRGLPPVTATAVVFLVLTSPLSANIVAEFRPDLFWGFLCGWSCFTILRRASLQPPWTNQMSVVLTTAAAIYWKPSAVMVTGALVGLASLLALGQTCLEEKHAGEAVAPAVRRYAVTSLALVCVLLPFFGPNAPALIEYFKLFVFVGPVFTFHGSLLEQVNYYLFGDTYGHNPSFLLWVGLVVPFAHAIVQPQSMLGASRRYWFFGIVVLVAYAIPTLSPVKTYFLGGAFYGCFLWFTLVGLVDLLRYAEASMPEASQVGGPAILAVLCLLTFRVNPLATPAPHAAVAAERRALADRTANALFADMQQRGVASATVFFQTPHPVASAYVVWRGRLAGKSIAAVEGFYLSSLEEDKRAMTASEYAVLTDTPQRSDFPGDRLSPDMLKWSKQQTMFMSISDVFYPKQGHVYLLRNQNSP